MRITLSGLHKMMQDGEKITMLTAYDASFAALLDAAGLDTLLIGDSLGNVLQGHESTLPVSLRDMVYHTQCVARGSKRAFIIGDMPFGTFQVSPQEAFRNAAEIMAAGAQMVKIEGGRPMLETISFLTERGIPVCGHLGLTPQSVHQLGGYRVQGRERGEADRLKADARALQDAGASSMVLELVPAGLAAEVSRGLAIPTIGIGAGPGCDGQVLVLHDMLGLNEGFQPKFLRTYADLASTVRAAALAYAAEVRAGSYPGKEHSFE